MKERDQKIFSYQRGAEKQLSKVNVVEVFVGGLPRITSELVSPHHDMVTALHLPILGVCPLRPVPGDDDLPLQYSAPHQGTGRTVVLSAELCCSHHHVLQH